MLNDRRGLKFWLSAWLPVAAGFCVIAVESTELCGANHTSRPLRLLFEAIFGQVGDARWEILHHYMRKSGHFLGYGVIGLAWLRAWWMTLPRSRFMQDAFLALTGTALMAGADEFHQSYLSNRTASARDVLLDCCGAVTLQLLAYIYMRLFMSRQLARNEQ